MSDGIMSGVNCMRACGSDNACESARTSSVFPSPGTPSISTWPDATSATSTCSTTADWPTIARPIDVRNAASISAACATDVDSVSSMPSPFLLDEREAPCGLEQRNRLTQFAGSARALVMDRRQERLPIEPCELRERDPAFVRSQTRVSVYPPCRGFLERAYRCRMKRRAAAVTQRELSRAANLLGQRS